MKRLVFRGRPRPPHNEEIWEDATANRRLSDAFLKVSPVYKKRRKRGGRHGFQMGFRGGSPEPGQTGEDDRPQADLPFDVEKGPSGEESVRKEFHVGRHCSARIISYHGLFHYKHRLISRLKLEIKKEIARQRVR